LAGMDLEIVGVLAEARHLDVLHALLHAPHQARPLVAPEVEASAALQVLEQSIEFAFRGVVHKVAAARFISARPMRSSGSTKSTWPVPIAACGMPKNAELASSCAITAPPAALIAATPAAPSEPVPLRTTPT